MPSGAGAQVTALVHVHTTASDGRLPSEEIARLAGRAGVRVVVLTDHDRLSPGAGWHHGVLVVAGHELTPRHNHLLVLGAGRPLPKRRGDGVNGDPQKSLEDARRVGAWVALAHPLDPAMPLAASSKAYVTLDFRHLDCPGLELWNAMSAFKRGLDRPWKALARALMPASFLAGPHPLLLALWDSLGRRRPWVALGGADAHAFPTGRSWLPVRIFSYRRHMRLITTGLWLEAPLSGRAAQDEALVLGALAAGRCFAALGQARGFACRLLGPDGQERLPGAELPHAPGWRLEARLPAWGEISLLRDGRPLARVRGRRFSWPIEGPGVWRVEARRWRPPAGWRPWIYCNPFYLREAN